MIVVRNTKAGRRYDVRLRDPAGRVYTRMSRAISISPGAVMSSPR